MSVLCWHAGSSVAVLYSAVPRRLYPESIEVGALPLRRGPVYYAIVSKWSAALGSVKCLLQLLSVDISLRKIH